MDVVYRPTVFFRQSGNQHNLIFKGETVSDT